MTTQPSDTLTRRSGTVNYLVTETYCFAPKCDRTQFGMFCKEHNQIVEYAPGQSAQLGWLLRNAYSQGFEDGSGNKAD